MRFESGSDQAFGSPFKPGGISANFSIVADRVQRALTIEDRPGRVSSAIFPVLGNRSPGRKIRLSVSPNPHALSAPQRRGEKLPVRRNRQVLDDLRKRSGSSSPSPRLRFETRRQSGGPACAKPSRCDPLAVRAIARPHRPSVGLRADRRMHHSQQFAVRDAPKPNCLVLRARRGHRQPASAPIRPIVAVCIPASICRIGSRGGRSASCARPFGGAHITRARTTPAKRTISHIPDEITFLNVKDYPLQGNAANP